MKQEQFIALIKEAGLDYIGGINNTPSFIVGLRVTTDFGVRSQSDWLSFDHLIFAMMTEEEAKAKIAFSKADMARAAKTRQGLLSDEIKQKSTIAKQNTTKRVVKNDNDVEKYLKKMRKRGEILAKRQ